VINDQTDQDGSPREMKILYVEDNIDNVYVLKRWFSTLGFELIVAGDGEQGITLAKQESPDLILMDLSLPGMDGEEAARRIKTSPSTRHIPVIALTANAMAGDREKALAAGCDDFDTKPIDLERLLEKIRAHAIRREL
jgi:CheY-like chemotaxis protein